MPQENPLNTCPNCSHDNGVDAKFCQNCGQRLECLCPNCSTINAPDANFCKECGQVLSRHITTSVSQPQTSPSYSPPLRHERGRRTGEGEGGEGISPLDTLRRAAPGALQARMVAAGAEVEGQRKPVTILFTDIVGSTALAEGLDPEEWREIVSGAHRLVGDAVYRYEGTIAQLLGDGVLAFFGAPLTHEDDPARAVRAALDIQAAMEPYRQELSGLVDDFHLRIGINTGEVVVGNIGHDLHMEYLALGDAVNLAARLQSAAHPGGILTSESTSRLVEAEIELNSLGDIQLKGKTEPQPVYEVLAVRFSPGRGRGVEGVAAPLVGRQDELARLQEALTSLREGRGQIMFLLGEAGIGKSRLVEEARLLTVGEAGQQMKWLEGRALSYGGALSYWPIIQLLQEDLGVSDGDPQARVRVALRRRLQELFGEDAGDTLPYLAHLLGVRGVQPGSTPIDSLDGETLKRGLHQALRTYFICAAQDQPLVLAFEDLHWADPSSLEALEALLPVTDQAPVVILCIARVDREHPSWALRFKAETDLGHRYIELQLEPLTADSSIELVDLLLKEAELPKDVQVRLLERSEGNPFYLEELIRSLIESGALKRQNGGWALVGDVEQIHIPDTLQGVLLARIDALEEGVRQTLQLASVIGRSFLYRILESISKANGYLDDHLARLQRADLVREKTRLPEREYIFKHALTQEAAYSSVLVSRRKRIHQQVGEILEEMWPDRQEELYGLLAYHFEAAGDQERSVSYLLKAGDRARALYAHKEAIEDYRRAIEILKDAGDTEQAGRTLMKLGLAYQIAFEFDLAQKAFEEAFALSGDAKPEPDPKLEIATHVIHDYEPYLTIPNLDPGLAADTHSHISIGELFSGLVEMRQPDLELSPEIAHSWDIQDAGKKYVFYLREDFYWTDGVQVTAHDFAYAWQRVLNPALDSEVAYLLYDIAGARQFHQGQADDFAVRPLDPFTLEVELEKPTGHFLQLLTNPAFLPVPRHVVEKLGEVWSRAENILTNGPFVLETFLPQKQVVLARNPAYRGRFPGNVVRHETRYNVDPEEALRLYRKGDLDILYLWLYTPEVANQLIEEFKADYSPSKKYALAYLSFNPATAPFDNPSVRRAFVKAVDTEAALGPDLWIGSGPARGGLIPPAIPGHSPDIGLGFDPDRARELLTQGGYPGGRGFPAVLLLATTAMEKIVREIQASWQDLLGITVELEFLQMDQFLAARKDIDFNIVSGTYLPDFFDPEDPIRFQIKNYSFHSLELDRAIESARRETDQARRLDLYRQVDQIMIESAAAMALAYAGTGSLVKPWARGLRKYYKGLKYLEIGSRRKQVPAEKAYQTIRDYDLSLDVPELDPGLGYDSKSLRIIQELFRGLVELRLPDLELLPDAARSWDILDAGRRYVFYLRKDSYWSDGVQVTAHDFVYGWKRALDPAINSYAAHLLFDIAGARDYLTGQSDKIGVRSNGQFTLEVELEKPAGYFLQLLTNGVFRPVPRHAVERYGSAWTDPKKIVTNGPYLIESLIAGQGLVLARNTGYTGAFPGNVGRYEMKLGVSPEGAIDRYRSGELDILYLYPYLPEIEDQLLEEFGESYSAASIFTIFFLSFDLSAAPFDDIRLRQAFAHAVDLEAVVRETSGRHSTPARGGLIVPGIPGHSPDIGLVYDPEHARRLLAEYSFEGNPDLSGLKLLTHSKLGTIAEKMAQNWAEVLGISVDVDVLDFSQFQEQGSQAGYSLVLNGYMPDFLDPEDIFRMQEKAIGFSSPEFNESLENARQETNQARRIALYQEADRIFIEAAAAMPVTYYSPDLLIKPWARGYTDSVESLKYLTVGERGSEVSKD